MRHCAGGLRRNESSLPVELVISVVEVLMPGGVEERGWGEKNDDRKIGRRVEETFGR